MPIISVVPNISEFVWVEEKIKVEKVKFYQTQQSELRFFSIFENKIWRAQAIIGLFITGINFLTKSLTIESTAHIIDRSLFRIYASGEDKSK
jgi:hypothetical protein